MNELIPLMVIVPMMAALLLSAFSKFNKVIKILAFVVAIILPIIPISIKLRFALLWRLSAYGG